MMHWYVSLPKDGAIGLQKIVRNGFDALVN